MRSEIISLIGGIPFLPGPLEPSSTVVLVDPKRVSGRRLVTLLLFCLGPTYAAYMTLLIYE